MKAVADIHWNHNPSEESHWVSRLRENFTSGSDGEGLETDHKKIPRQPFTRQEFFRNAKQLTDMEGATIRSEQGVTTALCLVSWIDSLLHFENYKQGTAGKLSKESLTIPSIVRQAQHTNLKAIIGRIQNDKNFIPTWLSVEEKIITRERKKKTELITLGRHQSEEIQLRV